MEELKKQAVPRALIGGLAGLLVLTPIGAVLNGHLSAVKWVSGDLAQLVGSGALALAIQIVHLAALRPPFPIFFYRPDGEHNVGVGVACPFVVNGKVGAHSSVHEIVLDERSDKGKLLRPGQLNRQGHFNFPGKLGGAGFLDLLHTVPEGGAV